MSDNIISATGAAATAQRLAVLEAVIEKGMQTFIEVGNALLEIRDRRTLHPAEGRTEKQGVVRQAMRVAMKAAPREATGLREQAGPIQDGNGGESS